MIYNGTRYRPEKIGARKTQKNRNKISKLLTKDYDLSTLPLYFQVPQKILTYFKLHQSQPLTQSIKYISSIDCPFIL